MLRFCGEPEENSAYPFALRRFSIERRTFRGFRETKIAKCRRGPDTIAPNRLVAKENRVEQERRKIRIKAVATKISIPIVLGLVVDTMRRIAGAEMKLKGQGRRKTESTP